VRDINPERASALKLKDARGAEVILVDQDGPAGKAGLKDHDVILSFNGRNLQTPEELRKLIRETPPGQTVELGISRDGQPMTLKTQLADRHRVVVMAPRAIRIPRIEIPIITTLSRRDGVVVENLTSQLGEVFGIKNGEGVLVRSVEKDSAGQKAGLRAGDVIVRVGNERVASTSDWNRLLRGQKAGPVQLGIVRDKRQQTLSLIVPERTREQSLRGPNFEGLDGSMEGFTAGMDDYKREMLDLQRLQPEIERAMRQAQENVQHELERNQREIERAQREQERAQRDAERAQEQADRTQERAQRQAERARELAQRKAEQAQERAQRDAERAREQAEREQERREREQEQAAPQNPPPAPKPPSSQH
jgi:hypothetical protein